MGAVRGSVGWVCPWWGVAKPAFLCGADRCLAPAMFGCAARWPGSGDEDDAAEPGEGVVELLGRWPPFGEVQGEFACGTGDPPWGAQVPAAISVSPSPMRLVQRARLWAVTLKLSQAALAPNFPDGRWLSPTPYLRSRIASSTTA